MKTKLQKSSYQRKDIKPVWCPGCGDYAVLNSLQKALVELEIKPEDVITISGIGCSGRFSHYMDTYSLHGTHGRAVPTALGAKAARPDLTVLAVGGDGDGLSIGGGHIAHAARKNVDMTYLLLDNRIYGLTKGQCSPTTGLEKRTKTTPYGSYEDMLEPVPMFLAYDISFIARIGSYQIKEMQELIKRAIAHKGFSIVYILSPCKTFPILRWESLKETVRPLPEDYTAKDKMEAYKYAYSEEAIYTGIFYEIEKPTLGDRLKAQVKKACDMQSEGDELTAEQVMREFA